MDEALLQWFREAGYGDISISGPLLLTKAKDLADRMGKADFKPTDGWLSRWKNCNGICYKVSHGEKKDADVAEATSWVNNIIPQILNSFAPEDVYNADETAFTTGPRQMKPSLFVLKHWLDQKRQWIVSLFFCAPT